jgi:cytochrome c oxidase subunit 3/cytochrome c oxidase subunit I+III
VLSTSVTRAGPESVTTMPAESYLPVLTALSLAGLFVGMLLGSVALAAVSATAGTLIVGTWLWPQAKPPTPGISLAAAGMALFILAEAILFSLLFASYLYIRSEADSWPPAGVEAPKLLVPIVNTVILLSSSAVLVWAEGRGTAGRTGLLRIGLAAVFLLGVIFLGLQMSEYARETMHIGDSTYASLFFVITAFHAAHVFMGLLMNGYVQAALWRQRGAVGEVAIHNAALYWHFVDVVWLVVLALVYISPHVLGA